MSAMRFGIAGATGRMGQALLRLIAQSPDATLAAALTLPDDPLLGRDAGLLSGPEPAGTALTTTPESACDVLIEFTTPAGLRHWLSWCRQHSTPLVSGTTGLTPEDESALHAAAHDIPIVWAPNMSTGVNLLLAVVQDLARKLDSAWDIEIVETHHRHKRDAPSGTARALLAAACAGRQVRSADVAIHGRQGPDEMRRAGQVGVHALRMGAIVGEHEVHFTSDAESLCVRHRAFSRDTFAAGALRAARWLVAQPPGLYDMRAVLGL